MDAVVGNKYIDIFSSLNIEVSKKIEGEFEVEEIISTFSNFFFNRMFLDITAIKNYKDLTNLQKLSMGINMDKVILLLDSNDSISSSKQFLSRLVSLGIYNFATDINGLTYLYANPNSYRDVAYLHEINNTTNNNANVDGVSSDNVSHEEPNNRIVLGIKNVTDSAGSTTLTYLIKKILSDYYNTMALEVDKRELTYFNDKDTLSVKEDELDDVFDKYSNINFFVVDLGKSKKDHLCNEVLYLIEPTTIKLNKLVLINPNIFSELQDKKVVLNKSLLNKQDIDNFELEADIKVYHNIVPFNDKEDCSSIIMPLLEKLGYVKETSSEEIVEDSNKSNKKSLFGLFRSK